MTKLLVINSSPMGDNSITRKLTNSFVAKFQEKHSDAQIITHDAADMNLPHLNGDILGAFFTPADQRTDAQSQDAARSDALIKAWKEADAIVIGAPMHNFGIPSSLKAYLDHILRAGETFKYTENGPVGLLEDKPVYAISARGGDYSENGYPQLDFVLPYLQSVMGFIGLARTYPIQANQIAMGEEIAAQAIKQAEGEIEKALAA